MDSGDAHPDPQVRFIVTRVTNRFNLFNSIDLNVECRYHAGMVIVADKLYVIGGFNSDNLFDSRAATAGLIECYDLR